MKMTRFLWVLTAILLLIAVIALVLSNTQKTPIRLGVLYSLTGTMAGNEAPLVDAVRLAVEEINEAGGLLGRKVEMVVVDGQSNNAVFAAEAERLISEGKVSVLFACWTSSCRKALKPIVEKYQHLLFYSLQYEGLEESPNIFYTGATANQQVIPGTHWALEKFGNNVYLLGSDYIFPRVANLLIKDEIKANSGTVLAERYRPMGESDFASIIADIQRLKPDVLFNTLNGSSNKSFFQALHQAGLDKLPVMSFSLAEVGLQEIGHDAFHEENYATWSYFQSLPDEPNQRFVHAFKTRFGSDRLTNDPIQSTYVGVKLWAQALSEAGIDDVSLVRKMLLQQSIAGPSGIAAIDRNTHHLWKKVYIGKARQDFQFDILWSSDEEIRPTPYPDYRSKYEWLELVQHLSGGR